MSTPTQSPAPGSAATAAGLSPGRWRLPRDITRTTYWLTVISLVTEIGIIVTGGAVRLTKSGLGCPTWPKCTPESLTNTPEMGIHGYIEFGNRTLTFVVAAAAVAVTVAVYKAGRRRHIKLLGLLSIAGVALQALIGGISVLVNLHWWAVAVHFLPSMVLVWIAAVLYMRIAEPDDAPVVERYHGNARTAVIIAATALCFVLITGTMVTGSGPHSGDSGVGMEGRLALDTEILTYVHAACMYIYLSATLVAVYLLRRFQAPKDAFNTSLVLVAMIVVQWAVGVTQFYLGVPRWTVPLHIAMSSVVVAFSAFLWAHGKRRVF